MSIELGHVSIAALAQMVAFFARESEPGKSKVSEYPHRGRLWLLASDAKMFVVEICNLKTTTHKQQSKATSTHRGPTQ